MISRDVFLLNFRNADLRLLIAIFYIHDYTMDYVFSTLSRISEYIFPICRVMLK